MLTKNAIKKVVKSKFETNKIVSKNGIKKEETPIIIKPQIILNCKIDEIRRSLSIVNLPFFLS